MTRNILLALLLVGCGPTQQAQETVSKRYQVGTWNAREFRLEDGTRCVAWVDSGITCEWKR